MRTRATLLSCLAIVTALAVADAPRAVGVAAPSAPSRLTDVEFWRLASGFSEPDGTFHSENLVSNEARFQSIVPSLTAATVAGRAYVGVGSEQNYTYMVAVRPALAFILDVRRGNRDLHLAYKALFEASASRVDFVSRLFSRRLGTDLEKDSSAVVLFNALHEVAPEQELYQANLTSVKERLKTGHGFPLTPEDEKAIGYILWAFYVGGPELAGEYCDAHSGVMVLMLEMGADRPIIFGANNQCEVEIING